jgi:hypothetical protein
MCDRGNTSGDDVSSACVGLLQMQGKAASCSCADFLNYKIISQPQLHTRYRMECMVILMYVS